MLQDYINDAVYGALSTINFNYHKCGHDITKEEMQQAVEWFITKFYEEE